MVLQNASFVLCKCGNDFTQLKAYIRKPVFGVILRCEFSHSLLELLLFQNEESII